MIKPPDIKLLTYITSLYLSTTLLFGCTIPIRNISIVKPQNAPTSTSTEATWQCESHTKDGKFNSMRAVFYKGTVKITGYLDTYTPEKGQGIPVVEFIYTEEKQNGNKVLLRVAGLKNQNPPIQEMDTNGEYKLATVDVDAKKATLVNAVTQTVEVCEGFVNPEVSIPDLSNNLQELLDISDSSIERWEGESKIGKSLSSYDIESIQNCIPDTAGFRVTKNSGATIERNACDESISFSIDDTNYLLIHSYKDGYYTVAQNLVDTRPMTPEEQNLFKSILDSFAQ